MNSKAMTDMERNNRTAIKAHLIDTAVMTLFCILQVVDGRSSWLYPLIIALVGFTPIVIEYILLKKNPDTASIMHWIALGFGALYVLTVFTAENNLVFAFVIPMIFVVSLYNNTRFMLRITVGTILINLAVCILGAQTGKFGYAGADSAIIQVVITILVGIYAYFVSNTADRNTHQKLTVITEAQNQTELVLNDISELSEQMKSGIENIHMDSERLSNATKITMQAMQELSSGAAAASTAVQKQLFQTEAIQEKVNVINDTATSITSNMQQTLSVLASGNRDVELLVEKVDISVQNSADVAAKLETLDKYMNEMNSIVEIITHVTDETSLLALNASIEAARAGEAGKGFAVVATEITKLAGQTTEATVHIADLIHNVSAAISEVVEVIRQMIDGINEEKQSTVNTAASFDTIQTNTLAIRDHIENLAYNITELKSANLVIVDSIQTISSVSEQVSTRANETMEAETENSTILTGIANKMEALMELIQR